MNGNEKSCNELNQEQITEGVSLLLGDPKKAILKLSGPMMVAMLSQSAYYLINAVWVSGLGSDALAAVGFVSPFFMIMVGLSNGLGAGVASSISRKVGAMDKHGADNTAMHAMLIMIIASVILTLVLLYFLEPMLVVMGAGVALDLAVEYGNIVFAGSILLVFQNTAFGILRGEGNTKRTMYAVVAGSLINLILDPILIYWAGLGIAGAAWGTIISLLLVSAVQIYWLLIKKDTYVSFSWKDFALSKDVITDILRVGIPASLEFLLFAIDAIAINSMLAQVSGTDAVAVYSVGWRVVMIAVIPLVAISIAQSSVAGAAFGSGRYGNLSIILNYSTKLGIVIGVATGIITGILAPQITAFFTYTPESAHLAPTMIAFIHVMCLFYPFMSPGIMSTSLFQGVGKGLTSLVLIILRDVILIIMTAYILGIVLGLGQEGIWWGIVLANIIGNPFIYLWTKFYISRLTKDKEISLEQNVAS